MKENEKINVDRKSIRKAFQIYSPAPKPNGPEEAIVGLEINMIKRTFSVQVLKGVPWFDNLFYALLSDRHIRMLIEQYQRTQRKTPYKLWLKEYSGGEHEVFITLGEVIGGFVKARTIMLMHICCGRLNEGFARSPMYIGDFVELVNFLGLATDMSVMSLREKAGMVYLKPMLAEYIDDFTTEVSHIL